MSGKLPTKQDAYVARLLKENPTKTRTGIPIKIENNGGRVLTFSGRSKNGEYSVYLPTDYPQLFGWDREPDKPRPKVLDATAGGRMMWFNKSNPIAFFIDQRVVEPTKLSNRATFEVKPDAVMDFRKLDFPDNTFYITVFDPPHLKSNAGDNSFMVMKYGKLSKDWKKDLHDGFAECLRVTKPGGTIIFKWNEQQIKVKEVIEAIGHEPLFGHTTNNKNTTIWMTFIKLPV